MSGVENVDQEAGFFLSLRLRPDESVVWPIRGTCTVSVDETGTVHWQLSGQRGRTVHLRSPVSQTNPLYLSERAELVYPHHAGEKVVDAAGLSQREVPEVLESGERGYGLWLCP